LVLKITSELLDLSKNSYDILYSIIVTTSPLVLLNVVTLYYIYKSDSNSIISINNYAEINLIPYLDNKLLTFYQKAFSMLPFIASPFLLRSSNEKTIFTFFFVFIPSAIILFFNLLF
jgi:hypothetical protein